MRMSLISLGLVRWITTGYFLPPIIRTQFLGPVCLGDISDRQPRRTSRSSRNSSRPWATSSTRSRRACAPSTSARWPRRFAVPSAWACTPASTSTLRFCASAATACPRRPSQRRRRLPRTGFKENRTGYKPPADSVLEWDVYFVRYQNRHHEMTHDHGCLLFV